MLRLLTLQLTLSYCFSLTVCELKLSMFKIASHIGKNSLTNFSIKSPSRQYKEKYGYHPNAPLKYNQIRQYLAIHPKDLSQKSN